MKQYLSVLLSLVMVLALILCAAGCTNPKNIDQTVAGPLKYIGDRDLKAKFDSITAIGNILDEVSVIDLNMEMSNIDGLEVETETNEEDSTSIDYYFRNEELIYVVYNGYGENVWEYHTTSKSGSPIYASFWDEGVGSQVRIDNDDDSLGYDFTVIYENVSSDFSGGAEKIFVTVSKDGESFTYCVDGNHYYISSAYYWKDGALHKYSADAENEKLTYKYDEEIVSGEVPEIDSSDKDMLNAGISSTGFESLNLLFGSHKSYMSKDGKLFINIETTLLFDSKNNAQQVIYNMQNVGVKASNFTVEENSNGEGYVVAVGTCFFSFTKDYQSSALEYVTNEFDDYVYKTVTLDDNGEISMMDNSSLSYY